MQEPNAVPAPRRTLGARRTKMRVMHRISVGIVAVYEQDPPPDNGQRALVFEASSVCTRVESFPEDWQRLSDDELTALRKSVGH